MKHWHPFARTWAIFVAVAMVLYTLGSPAYLWAIGGLFSLKGAFATMIFAALAAGAVGIPLIGLGVVLVSAGVRIGRARRNKERHAA